MNFIPKVLVFRGRGVASALIRWQTRTAYSHAAVLIEKDLLIEAWQCGVQYKQIKDWRGIEVFEVPDMSVEGWLRAVKFLRKQIGRPYDWMGVVRFVTRRKEPDDDSWFCSELVSAALEAGGVRLFERVSHANISPGMLACSPLLTPSPWKP